MVSNFKIFYIEKNLNTRGADQWSAYEPDPFLTVG